MANLFNNPYQQMYPQMPYQQQAQPQPQQIQNGGFISIPNEEMVYSYPVAPGNCVRFKVEGKPIYFEKTASYSQFEDPKIEKYRLVKEEVARATEADLSEMDKIKSDIREIWGKIDEIENSKKYAPKRDNKNGES